MPVPVRFGLMLAAIVTVLTLLIAVTKIYTIPVFAAIGAILLFTLINIVVVFLGLSRTAADHGYGKQVLNALIIGLVGGLTIALTSYIQLNFVFADYIEEFGNSALDFWAGMMPPEALEKAQQDMEAQTPVSQALQGMMGTIVTSLISGLIVAVFKRRKG